MDKNVWQPIETAPKDKDVWVFGLARVFRTSDQFLWQGQAGFNPDSGEWWATSHDDCGEVLCVDASNWMPLPPPPGDTNG